MDALKSAKRRFWIAVAVTIAVIAGPAATWVWSATANPKRDHILIVHEGYFRAIFLPGANNNIVPYTLDVRRPVDVLYWTPGIVWPVFELIPASSLGPSGWSLWLPLWPLLLPPAIIAYRAHGSVRRLSRAGCKHCGYSRSGLAANAPCPECGAAA